MTPISILQDCSLKTDLLRFALVAEYSIYIFGISSLPLLGIYYVLVRDMTHTREKCKFKIHSISDNNVLYSKSRLIIFFS